MMRAVRPLARVPPPRALCHRAARERLDAAERQGRAFDQQLELLAAVRAYFVEHQRAHAQAAAAADGAAR
jgi:hypothetical protein